MPRLGITNTLKTILEESIASLKSFWETHVDLWQNQNNNWEQSV